MPVVPDLLHGNDYILPTPGDDPALQGSRPLNVYPYNPDSVNAISVTASDRTPRTSTIAARAERHRGLRGLGRPGPRELHGPPHLEPLLLGVRAPRPPHRLERLGLLLAGLELPDERLHGLLRPGRQRPGHELDRPRSGSPSATRSARSPPPGRTSATAPTAPPPSCPPPSTTRSSRWTSTTTGSSTTSTRTATTTPTTARGERRHLRHSGRALERGRPHELRLPDRRPAVAPDLRLHRLRQHRHARPGEQADRDGLRAGHRPGHGARPDPRHRLHRVPALPAVPRPGADRRQDRLPDRGLRGDGRADDLHDHRPLLRLRPPHQPDRDRPAPLRALRGGLRRRQQLVTYPDLSQSTADPSSAIDGATGRTRLTWALSPGHPRARTRRSPSPSA